MNIGITGASGYVGSKVSERFARTDHDLFELGREPSDEVEQFIPFSLTGDISADSLADLDVVIHFAYDFEPRSWQAIRETNVEGTLQLFDAADRAGTELIQISSLSACENCRSRYGRAKYVLDEAALDRDFAVVRPGMVFGRELGGALASLASLVDRSPVAPLPLGGPHVHYLVHYADLGTLLLELCERDHSFQRPIAAAHPAGKSYRTILQTLASARDTSIRFVPAPMLPGFYALRLIEWFGISTTVRSDSLIGLVRGTTSPDFASLSELGVDLREFSVDSLK